MMNTLFRRKTAALVAVLALGLAAAGGANSAVPAQGVDATNLPELISTAKTPADHEALAAWYEQQAGEARKQVAFHERMIERYEIAPYAEYYKGTHHDTAGFVMQCKALMQANEQAEKDFTALAKLHRQMAADAKK